MSITQVITAISGTPPSTSDPANFDARADAFVGAFPSLQSQINTWAEQANALAEQVNDDADETAILAAAAIAGAGIPMWASGTFADGDIRWSPTTRQTYRKVGAGSGTTDPAIDYSGWTQISGGGSARVRNLTSVSSPLSWTSDQHDTVVISALANALTISADSGTPYPGKRLLFAIKDNGTARALTFQTGASKRFRAMGRTIPTTTVVGKWLYVGCVYNGVSERWDVISVAREL